MYVGLAPCLHIRTYTYIYACLHVRMYITVECTFASVHMIYVHWFSICTYSTIALKTILAIALTCGLHGMSVDKEK